MAAAPFFATFVLVALASYLIGKFFTRIGLPHITGYLFTGALAGPFLLSILPADAVPQLRFVDQISLAVIAFMVGSELYLREIRQRLPSIVINSLSVASVGLLLGTAAIVVLTGFFPFMQDRPFAHRVVIALLGAVVLLALSPPSTLAVIKEVRAKGPFTRLALSITVFMDVLIIVLFAVTTSLVSIVLANTGFGVAFLAPLALDLSLALGLGVAVGRFLQMILATRLRPAAKLALILLIGYGVYLLSDQVKVVSPALVGFEVYIEPLLICLIGGFMVTNRSTQRHQFAELLHAIGPTVYVAFFTLTGLALKLDMLAATLPIALALFLMRVGGIYGGVFIGSRLSKESETFKRYGWMALVTQAGIALGLAREVTVQFPFLSAAFSTLIIAVIVLNEIFGPMLLKAALTRAQEANLPYDRSQTEPVRDALILGVELQSLALARELQEQNWRVVLADTEGERVAKLVANVADVEVRQLPAVDAATLARLVTANTDAIVAMLRNDDDNYAACEYARDKYDVPRLIVRPHEMANAERFAELGALVIHPTSAMVSLLQQAVVSPQSAALLLARDPDQLEFLQGTVTNPELDGALVRDLRLPSDVRILGIKRDGRSILANGNTPIQVGDDLTLVGAPGGLQAALLLLGY